MGATAFNLLMQLKANDSEIQKYPLCLGNIFQPITWKKRLNGCVHDFSVDYRTFDTSIIIDIHESI